MYLYTRLPATNFVCKAFLTWVQWLFIFKLSSLLPESFQLPSLLVWPSSTQFSQCTHWHTCTSVRFIVLLKHELEREWFRLRWQWVIEWAAIAHKNTLHTSTIYHWNPTIYWIHMYITHIPLITYLLSSHECIDCITKCQTWLLIFVTITDTMKSYKQLKF